MTNDPLHVCHAYRCRVACHVVLNVSACYQADTRSYHVLSFRTFFQALVSQIWTLDSPGAFRRLFMVDLPTISYSPIHRTYNNGASIPAANRLYQGQTVEVDATHMPRFHFPRQDLDPLVGHPGSTTCGRRSL